MNILNRCLKVGKRWGLDGLRDVRPTPPNSTPKSIEPQISSDLPAAILMLIVVRDA